MKYNRIIVTGKTGTLGYNLPFPGFSSSDYDLTDTNDAFRMVKDSDCDAIIHCAAKVGGLQFHLDQRYLLFRDNVLMNFNVLEAAKNNKVKRVLSFLSSCIFSEKSPTPYSEENIHDDQPFLVHEPYGNSKRFLEIQSRYLFEEFGLTYNCAIPVNMFGPGDDFNFISGHCVGVLIRKAHEAALNNTDFVCWGTGKESRNFLYTKDAAILTKWALEEYTEKSPLIFCHDDLIEIGDIAQLIAKRFSIEKRLKFDTEQQKGQKIRSVTGAKLANLINFKFTPMEQALNETIDWYLENYPKVRL